MIDGLCQIFIMGLHKILFKVCLNGSAVSRPDLLIMNLMWDRGLSLFIAFKVISKWQHICGKFQLVASYRQLVSVAGTCHTWQLPQETLLVVLYCKIEKGFIAVVRK